MMFQHAFSSRAATVHVTRCSAVQRAPSSPKPWPGWAALIQPHIKNVVGSLSRQPSTRRIIQQGRSTAGRRYRSFRRLAHQNHHSTTSLRQQHTAAHAACPACRPRISTRYYCASPYKTAAVAVAAAGPLAGVLASACAARADAAAACMSWSAVNSLRPATEHGRQGGALRSQSPRGQRTSFTS